MMAAMESTYPAAGVIATSPQTAPVAAPVAEGFPQSTQSTVIQLRAAKAAAILVVTRAFTATPLIASALPALKPNQPNHSKAAPRMTNGTLLGRAAWLPYVPASDNHG